MNGSGSGGSIAARVAFAAIALVATAAALRDVQIRTRRIERRQADARVLERLQSEMKVLETVHQRWVDHAGRRLPSLEQISSDVAPNLARPELREPSAQPLPQGWWLRRVELLWSHASMEAIAQFLQKATEGMPAWQPVEIRISPTDPEGAYARLWMVLEGLESVSAEP